MENTTQIHRRKSSQSDDENTLVISTKPISNEPTTPISPLPTRAAPPPPLSPLSPSQSHARAPTSPLPPKEPRIQAPRSRVHSTPAPPPLMGHSRTMSISLPSPRSPNGSAPGSAGYGPASGSAGPYRTSFITLRPRAFPTRSISTPYSPPLPSPLSFSFPADAQSHPRSPNGLTPSVSAPENASSAAADAERERQGRQKHARHHSRLQSRNLSIFFPRPGSLPASNTISEDGSQELEFPSSSDMEAMPIPSAGSSVSFPSGRRMTTSLQNGKSAENSLGAGFTFGGRSPSISGPTPPLMSNGPSSASSTVCATFTILQFTLGAFLWVSGQQIGSLGTTGLGIGVVFDAFGVGIAGVLRRWLNGSKYGWKWVEETVWKRTHRNCAPIRTKRLSHVFLGLCV
ncbi:hypothetical protein BT96DRAFT_990979 [Gymnopus androsaceus JB14]|uniref:Uncharacterized protein n=1 Tax=Gymnopus androsaceus JB14 TaxID=1447944 RepID=A0A6A4I1I8_9AGAR|nr:hypothetical protein BT96DRAFT_990979 [Gymnopus androsaceus JB14]